MSRIAKTRVPDCVARYPGSVERCATPEQQGLRPDPLADAATSRLGTEVNVLDVTDLLCRDGSCPAVIGGLISYFDDDHMTTSLARTLYPEVSGALRRALQGIRGA